MTTNLSAVLHGAGELRIEDRALPSPASREVVVEVGAVGICGSDVHYYEHGRIGRYVVEEPMVVGHESAGIITAVGEGVPAERIGQLVALEPGVPCRSCTECLTGHYNLCRDVVFFATPPVDGSIAEYVAIDAQFAHPVPPGVSVEAAAMAEPVSVGVWAARTARISAGDRVLVTGAGPIGLFAAQVARAFGATGVTVIDVNEHRLATARTLGFDTETPAEPHESTFSVLLECSGAPAALSTALPRLAPTGRVVLIGMGADTVTLDVPLLQGNELTVSGIFRYANTYPTALDLIASGAVKVDPLVSHRFGLRETEEALTLARREPRSLKAIVLPHS